MKKYSDADLASAYIKGQKTIDAFYRRKAKAQLLGFSLDRELERHREKRLRRSGESATEVNVGEFREAAE
jgi:hypothetical protein